MGVFKNLSTERLKKKKLERDIQAEILNGLECINDASFDRLNNVPVYDRKYECYRRPGKFSRKGTSDIVGVFKGRYVAIEVKTVKEYNYYIENEQRILIAILNKEELSKKDAHLADQILYQEQKISAGGICFFTCSLEHTLTILGGLCR